MKQSTLIALVDWANTVSSVVQSLCDATGNREACNRVHNATEWLYDRVTQEQANPEPGHISDAEAVACQAERIRTLVADNVRLSREAETSAAVVRELEAQISALVKASTDICYIIDHPGIFDGSETAQVVMHGLREAIAIATANTKTERPS